MKPSDQVAALAQKLMKAAGKQDPVTRTDFAVALRIASHGWAA